VTLVTRSPQGAPSAITAPFGQVTALSVDANQYLAAIANPAGGTVNLTTTQDGLLTAFQNARGFTSTYFYDLDGRLVLDLDPAGGSQTLVATDDSTSHHVAMTSALGRTTTYDTIGFSLGQEPAS